MLQSPTSPFTSRTQVWLREIDGVLGNMHPLKEAPPRTTSAKLDKRRQVVRERSPQQAADIPVKDLRAKWHEKQIRRILIDRSAAQRRAALLASDAEHGDKRLASSVEYVNKRQCCRAWLGA